MSQENTATLTNKFKELDIEHEWYKRVDKGLAWEVWQAAIQHYKDSILAEAGEPAAYRTWEVIKKFGGDWKYKTDELELDDSDWEKLYTPEAIIAACKSRDEEIKRLTQYRKTDGVVLGAMKLELDELRQQLAAAQEEIAHLNSQATDGGYSEHYVQELRQQLAAAQEEIERLKERK